MMTVRYHKKSSLGNEFVILDGTKGGGFYQKSLSTAQARMIASKNNIKTKGCDQVLIIRPEEQEGSVGMEIYNQDGTEAQACGNGGRCVGLMVLEKNPNVKTILVKTKGGDMKVARCKNTFSHQENNESPLIDIILSRFLFSKEQIPFHGTYHHGKAPIHHDLPHGFLVNLGNPHCVFLFEGLSLDALTIKARTYGPSIEKNLTLFPQGVNVHFLSPKTISDTTHGAQRPFYLTSWERGAGLTQACGTGASAAFLALAKQNHLTSHQCLMVMRGGVGHMCFDETKKTLSMGAPVKTHEMDDDMLELDDAS